jgi:glycine/serine hydroxymethyltransferase
MKEPEMRRVGKWIAAALNGRNDSSVLANIRRQVAELADAFPLYSERREKQHAGV